MANKKITTGVDLNKILKVMCDKFMNDASRGQIDEATDGPGKGETLLLDDPEGGNDSQVSSDSSSNDDDTMKTGDVDTDDIVEKLNTIRSGRSFNDSGVKDSLQKYINNLDTAEKTALFAFLKGIAQITTGEVSSTTAVEPQDPDPGIEMKKKSEKSSGENTKTVVKKPTVVVKPPQGQNKKVSSPEDTSAPITPIKKK